MNTDSSIYRSIESKHNKEKDVHKVNMQPVFDQHSKYNTGPSISHSRVSKKPANKFES